MESNSFGHSIRIFHPLFFSVMLVLCFSGLNASAQANSGNGFHLQQLKAHDYQFSFNAGSEIRTDFRPVSKPLHESRTDVTFALKADALESAERDTVPLPRDVMFRSLILPGWGQYTNRQSWKIPLVYALIGGVAYYSYYADTRYRGYRAAFYNSNPENTDFRFGGTPSWIDPNASPDFLRESRNFFRNRRDFLIIATVLSYGLNVLDAYVFAHMRDFDVSDDLSSRSFEIGSSAFTASAGSAPVPLVSLNLRF
ncbi:MAG: DUF5683 domain-containing protein [Balneolia bacterium]|nr:DUF5683 domain-containing protein [Balneolia bacterium]